MKNLAIAILLLATAFWANAATLWSAHFEDGEINPGGADSAIGNTTVYPAGQPTAILDGTYGWASKAYNLTDSRSFSTIVDTASFSGANSVQIMNRAFRTDIMVTIAASSLYTFSIRYMVDATTDFNNDNLIQERIFFRDFTTSVTLADDHPSQSPILPTFVTYGQWQVASVTWDSTGSPYVGALHRFRLATQFGDAYDNLPDPFLFNGGAYMDAMSFDVVPVPEPATLSLLGLGGLGLLLRRRAANR